MSNKLLKHDENFDGMPPWMAAMQKAVLENVSSDDIKEIVQNQVKRAKEGDQNAIKFVFAQLMGGSAFKGATFVQNNNYGTPPASKPVQALPGSEEKIEAMRRRRAAHEPLHSNGDGGEVDLT